MGVHPAVSMPQPGNPGVPQVIYQAQQMQVNVSNASLVNAVLHFEHTDGVL